MQDYRGIELKVGDKVAYISRTYGGSELRTGTVCGFVGKSIRLSSTPRDTVLAEKTAKLGE